MRCEILTQYARVVGIYYNQSVNILSLQFLSIYGNCHCYVQLNIRFLKKSSIHILRDCITPALFTRWSIPRQESDCSFIYARGISILSQFFMISPLDVELFWYLGILKTNIKNGSLLINSIHISGYFLLSNNWPVSYNDHQVSDAGS
jgi:hypothetical protein